jgi:tetratricopeptide (TPR) repeat protein
MLKKGVPSTFTNVKGLYADPSKRQAILKLVEGYLENPPKPAETENHTNGTKPDRLKESCLYFLTQHYNYHITRDLPKALKLIEETIELDPKSVIYTQTKARIYKHLGDTVRAAELMNQARELDEKDRYINTKCAKYQLRNNQNDLAIATMGKFTRNEAVGGPFADLLDMQCMWFITEDGEAYLRRGKLNLALKRFKQIFDIFEVWEEDQFDFHQFSMRKGPIRAYIDMVRWEDHLRDHPFFSRSAISAVQMYVMLHDVPELSRGKNIPGWDKMTEVDRKKALKKQKKAQEEEQRKLAEKSNPTKKNPEGKKEDLDPTGTKLLETKTPLEDAMPYVNFLVSLSSKNILAQLVSFDIFLRRGKFFHSYSITVLTWRRETSLSFEMLEGSRSHRFQ